MLQTRPMAASGIFVFPDLHLDGPAQYLQDLTQSDEAGESQQEARRSSDVDGQAEDGPIRLLLADDHAVVAAGLAALLKTKFELEKVVSDGRALVAAAAELKPDVIVTDLSMPLLNGIDAIQQIRRQQPDANIVALTMHGDPDLAVRAFRAGARGYVLKTSPSEELMEAVFQVYKGNQFLTSLIASDVIELMMQAQRTPRQNDSPLTPRQREILQLVGEGHTMKQVASLLGISPRTAESHKYEIMRILDAKSTAELVRHALRMGLVHD